MSNSFSPKTSLNQETLEKVLVALRQPFSIAVFASLAAHGLLWAALPNMFDQKKEPEPQRKVQVVELSAAERGQLPPLGLNPVPQTLLPAKPLQPTQSGTKLPDPKQYNDPLFSSTPAWEPPPPTFPLSGLPPSIFNEPNSVTTKPQPSPSPKSIASPKAPIAPKPNNTASTSTDNSSPKPTTTPTAQSTPLSSKQLAGLQQAGQDAQRSRQLQALYTFNGPKDNTERAEISKKNSATFYESAARLSGGNYKRKYYGTTFLDKGNISDLFPAEACPYVKGATLTSVAAIIKPDGQLAEPPSVLVPSGFTPLDNTAIDYVAKKNYAAEKEFKTDGNYQIIRFNFFFDPKSACSPSGSPT